MQKTKARPRSAATAPVPPPAPAGFARTHLLPFLDRFAGIGALLAVGIAVARIVSTYSALSLTTDEPGHFACGLQYLAQHVYEYESQHPPLARAMTALVPYLHGVRPLGGAQQDMEGIHLLVLWGPDRLLPWMRLGILPFFLLSCAVVFVWARHYFGGAAGFFAVVFFTLIPQVLADAGLATTDMGLAACLGAAFLSLLLWAESPTWWRSAMLGFTCALAALAKFTALGFLPAGTVLAALGYLAIRRPGLWKLLLLIRARILPFALALAVGGLTVWAAYFFSYGEVPGWDGSLPAPEFFDGIQTAMKHNGAGHLAYLFNRFGNTGWWYYFPVALAVKTPIALLLAVGLGIAATWNRRFRNAYLPIAFALGVLAPSMTSHVNIGIRHVLPIYIAFAILAAVGATYLLRWNKTPAVVPITAVALIITWMAVPGAKAHPDYLAYFNAFAGEKPENILLDSNFDWGQDWKFLAHSLRERNVREIHGYRLDTVGVYPIFKTWYGLPDLQPLSFGHLDRPEPGWTVVRIKEEKFRSGMPPPEGEKAVEPWYNHATPVERIGGFLLYRAPDDSSSERHAADKVPALLTPGSGGKQ